MKTRPDGRDKSFIEKEIRDSLAHPDADDVGLLFLRFEDAGLVVGGVLEVVLGGGRNDVDEGPARVSAYSIQ